MRTTPVQRDVVPRFTVHSDELDEELAELKIHHELAVVELRVIPLRAQSPLLGLMMSMGPPPGAPHCSRRSRPSDAASILCLGPAKPLVRASAHLFAVPIAATWNSSFL